VQSCSVLFCLVPSCSALLVLFCFVLSCSALSGLVLPWSVFCYLVLSCSALSCPVLPCCLVLPCPALFCFFLPCSALFCLIVPCFVFFCRFSDLEFAILVWVPREMCPRKWKLALCLVALLGNMKKNFMLGLHFV